MSRAWRRTAVRVLVVVGTLLAAPLVLAADPTATPAAGGDPRSEGEGPGFVGEPLLAIGLVLAVGLVAVLATWLFVRLTDRRR